MMKMKMEMRGKRMKMKTGMKGKGKGREIHEKEGGGKGNGKGKKQINKVERKRKGKPMALTIPGLPPSETNSARSISLIQQNAELASETERASSPSSPLPSMKPTPGSPISSS